MGSTYSNGKIQNGTRNLQKQIKGSVTYTLSKEFSSFNKKISFLLIILPDSFHEFSFTVVLALGAVKSKPNLNVIVVAENSGRDIRLRLTTLFVLTATQ